MAVIRIPEWNRYPNSFGHIFSGGYAAGYYSYKWAEVLAADAFAAFEEAGIYDRATAQRFVDDILSRGGSRDPLDAFVAFRGRAPDIKPLLRQHGIAPDGSTAATCRPVRWGETEHVAARRLLECQFAAGPPAAARRLAGGQRCRMWSACRKPNSPTTPSRTTSCEQLGYQAVASGQKTYNGVALLAREHRSSTSSRTSPTSMTRSAG